MAQLGARLNGIQEVRGSIPLVSTRKSPKGDFLVETMEGVERAEKQMRPREAFARPGVIVSRTADAGLMLRSECMDRLITTLQANLTPKYPYGERNADIS